MKLLNHRIFASALAIFAVGAMLAGCKSPEKNVEGHMGGLRVAWQTNLARQSNLPERPIDWPGGVALVLSNNAKLKQSRIDLTNTIEGYRQVYRDLVPTLNARAGVTKTLSRLDTFSLDDVTFSADSFFNVPGVVNFSARLYLAKLMMLRARTAVQLAEREQIIELYRLYTGVQELSVENDKLAIQRANASAMTRIDPFTGRLMETELQVRETSALKADRSLQQRASDIFGDYSYRWKLSTNGLPDLRYSVEPLPLSDTNRVAQLQMKLLALELEAARTTIKGIKLRYWPELNIFVSGPPLYQRSAGRAIWWSAEEVRGSADVFWQLDTRGYISRQLKATRRSQELQKERFRQESLALMDRLLFTQQLMKVTQEQLDRTDREIQFLLAIPPAQDFLAVQKYAADYRNLTQQQIRLRRELAEFNALFWFMDESAWPKSTPLPPS
jgi:hypothetical protein